MDRTTTTVGGSLSGNAGPPNPVSTKIEGAAQKAHEITNKVADNAAVQVDRLSATAHRAVDSAADAAASAAERAGAMQEQAKQAQVRLTESASASIRSRPIATVAGALVVGYLLGRLARL